jgi:hypothetical protein
MCPRRAPVRGAWSDVRNWTSTVIRAVSSVPRVVRILVVWPICLAAVIVPISFGAHLFIDHFRPAGPEYLIRFIFGDRAPSSLFDQHSHPLGAAIRGMTAVMRRALEHDQLVILGYFLVLMTCAFVFAFLAFSRSGKKLSGLIIAAVVIATVSDLIENKVISLALDHTYGGIPTALPDIFWKHAPATMATVKWCALVIAVLAIPAALFSVVRVVSSYARLLIYRLRHRGEKDWWDAALAPAQESTDGDPQLAWRQAYYVPGAEALIPKPEVGRVPDDRQPTALCLSGGGIRSACVAMGAMQTISGPRLDVPNSWDRAPALDDFNYVISVSGGGYSAGARLLAVQSDEDRDGQSGGATHPVAARFNPGSPEFDFIRRRSSYIADSPGALVRALAEVLKNLLASLFIVFSAAILLGWVLGWFVAMIPLAAVVPVPRDASTSVRLQSLEAHPVAALAAVGIPLAVAIVCTAVGLLWECFSTSKASAIIQALCGWCGKGAALLAVLVFILTVALPWLMRLTAPLAPSADSRFPAVGMVGGVAAVAILQYGATLFSMLRKNDGFANPSRWKKLVPVGVVRIAPVLITLATLFVVWALVLGIIATRSFSNATGGIPLGTQLVYLGGIALLTLVLSSFDVTSLSLHPFYRRRLARTFAVRRIDGKAAGYPASEATSLDTYGRTNAGGPKFVFAAAAAVSDDDVRPAPGLNAVSYVMTADFVGGPALGWLNTPQLRKAAPPRIERDLTVQAAVAISGAAFASAMGRQSKGFQTLLALSGARLGTWLPNPTFVRNAQSHAGDISFPKALPLLRGAGYFYRELFGINKSDARLVQVTDGGHYENLGLVEALRRRCRLIYCIDGGGDTPPLLSGLADAIRLAKFELGVEITLDKGGPYGVENVAPGSGEPFPEGHAFRSLNDRITKDAVIRGKITYPAAAGLGGAKASTGYLIVAKAVLWRDLPEWILTYAAGSAEFPNDKTSDQWFNEAQFAAYIELGRLIGTRALQVRGDGTLRAPDEQSHTPATLSGPPVVIEQPPGLLPARRTQHRNGRAPKRRASRLWRVNEPKASLNGDPV